MRVHEIMTRPPCVCRVDTTLSMASRRMSELGCGALAVLDGRGRLAGIVTDRDLALAIAGDGANMVRTPVERVMTRRVRTCAPEEDVREALDRMAAAKVLRLPVVEGGELKGMLSIDDVILWGVTGGGVGLHALVHALRSICAARSVRPEYEMPPL